MIYPNFRRVLINRVPHWLRRLARLAKLWVHIPNIHLLLTLGNLEIWPFGETYNPKLGSLTLKNYEMVVFLDTKGHLIAETQGLRIVVESEQDILTVREVINQRPYDFLYQKLCADPVVFWDVGMNIGVTSLLFASHPKVIKVYGYEPFAHTFACATETFLLNPLFQHKICAYNYGLADREAEHVVEYSWKNKASMGQETISTSARSKFSLTSSDISLETISVKDAASTLRTIVHENPNAKIVAKIDCEGAEYKIITALEKAGLLTFLWAGMIELHQGRGAEMKHLFEALGFRADLHEDVSGAETSGFQMLQLERC